MNAGQLSKARNPLLPAALAAIKRAAQRARREALATGTAIVVSRDGRLARLEGKDMTEDISDVRDVADHRAGRENR